MRKYKIGDTVTVKSIDWYNEHKSKLGCVISKFNIFTEKMSNYCGKTAIITKYNYDDDAYYINVDNNTYWWDDFMFEDNHNEYYKR